QAEDGIRDRNVTGVQTCALPIYNVIEDYLEPEEVIPMQVNLDAMGHIVSRLTEIYPNPIQASVRELISNAVDATMDIPEADRKPIEVGVSAFDNNFTVRDYRSEEHT